MEMNIRTLKQTIARRHLPPWILAGLKRLYTRWIPDPVSKAQYIPAFGGRPEFVVPKGHPKGTPPFRDGLPLPPVHLRLGYGNDDEEFFSGGKEDVDRMLDLLKESEFEIRDGAKILEFGCAGGRMLRHLKPYAERGEVWGTDIFSEAMLWCNGNLRPPFNFATSTMIPHLPFEDRYFDLIFAGSVFTHIDDLADTWLLELRRILSPQGRMYLTIHDNSSIHLLDTSDSTVAKLVQASALYQKHRSNFGMMVLERGRFSQVFYDLEYFRTRKASPMLELISATPGAYGYQTAVILARRGS